MAQQVQLPHAIGRALDGALHARQTNGTGRVIRGAGQPQRDGQQCGQANPSANTSVGSADGRFDAFGVRVNVMTRSPNTTSRV